MLKRLLAMVGGGARQDNTPRVIARRAVVHVIDVSLSMGFREGDGTRLDAAKHAVLAFNRAAASGSQNIAVAVIAFAEQGAVVVPWTTQLTSPCVVARVRGLVPMPHTNVQAGLDEAERVLTQCDADQKEVMVLSDGGSNHGDPVPVACRLKQRGVIVSCVGFGQQGEDCDEPTLKRMASADETGRPFYRLISGGDGLVVAYTELGCGLMLPE